MMNVQIQQAAMPEAQYSPPVQYIVQEAPPPQAIHLTVDTVGVHNPKSTPAVTPVEAGTDLENLFDGKTLMAWLGTGSSGYEGRLFLEQFKNDHKRLKDGSRKNLVKSLVNHAILISFPNRPSQILLTAIAAAVQTTFGKGAPAVRIVFLSYFT